jgi:hypothetical protein
MKNGNTLWSEAHNRAVSIVKLPNISAMGSPENEKEMRDLTEASDKRSGEMTCRTNEQAVNNDIESVTSNRSSNSNCEIFDRHSLDDYGSTQQKGGGKFRSMIREL